MPRLHALTGHAPPYIFPVARYLWFRKHGNGTRVATLLMLNDWITFLLSGERVAEHSNAGESMLYDVSRREWSREILDALDVPADILPPLRAPGSLVGAITRAAAAATGLPEGTPVFVGGADTESALLGSGVHQVGQTAAVLGTTTPVQMVTDRPVIDPGGRLWTSCHVVPDRWVLESNAGDTGDTYRWLLELTYGATDAAAYAAAEEAIASAASTDRQIFCHLGPVIFSLGEMSPFKPAGLLFRFPLLHVDRPVRGEVLRAMSRRRRTPCAELRADHRGVRRDRRPAERERRDVAEPRAARTARRHARRAALGRDRARDRVPRQCDPRSGRHRRLRQRCGGRRRDDERAPGLSRAVPACRVRRALSQVAERLRPAADLVAVAS
jgi:hypothetical protein